jgi:streptomycin 6-kinase
MENVVHIHQFNSDLALRLLRDAFPFSGRHLAIVEDLLALLVAPEPDLMALHDLIFYRHGHDAAPLLVARYANLILTQIMAGESLGICSAIGHKCVRSHSAEFGEPLQRAYAAARGPQRDRLEPLYQYFNSLHSFQSLDGLILF